MIEVLTTYVEEQLNELGEPVDVRPDDDLVQIGFDSIAYVRLLDYISKRFGIEVPDVDVTIEHFGTLARIADYLSSRAQGNRNQVPTEDPS